MENRCLNCGAPCRFVLCDACYEIAEDDTEHLPMVRVPIIIVEVGLPVTVDGISRF